MDARPTPPAAPAWYCVRAGPRQEARAAAALARLDGVDVFSPRIRFRKRTRRGMVWFVEALFPGYLFARFDLPACLRAVTYSPGVIGVVHFGERFPALAGETIAAIRAQTGDQNCIVVETPLAEGDAAQLAAGPFAGLAVVVTRLLPARERVRVLLDFLGRPMEVEVAREDLLVPRAHPLRPGLRPPARPPAGSGDGERRP